MELRTRPPTGDAHCHSYWVSGHVSVHRHEHIYEYWHRANDASQNVTDAQFVQVSLVPYYHRKLDFKCNIGIHRVHSAPTNHEPSRAYFRIHPRM